jgi:hypothetical protein
VEYRTLLAMTLLSHAVRLLLSTGDLPDAPALALVAKPVLYVAVFAVYARAVDSKAHWTKALLAGAVRTALGFALGVVVLVLVTTVPAPIVHVFLGLCRFGLWYGLGRLFYPRGSGRGATLMGMLGVAVNLAVDWLLLGGAVVSPA